MRILFLGTPQFAVPSLQAIVRSEHQLVTVIARPDRPAGRGMRMHKPEVIAAAEELNVPTLQPPKIREESFLESMRALNVDLGIVVAYGRILPDSLLSIPRHGFINVHASLLPRYRGAAPIQRAIEHGELETGVTVMRVDRELDHGPLFAQSVTPIGPDEAAPELSARLASLGGGLLQEIVDQIAQGQAVEHDQDHDKTTYAPKIEKEEGLIDWGQSARSIYDKFRAFDPWPGVFCVFEGETVKLSEIRLDAAVDAPPGTVSRVDSTAIVVAAGDGTLSISTVQRPGKAPVRAVEYARARKIHPGTRFGD